MPKVLLIQPSIYSPRTNEVVKSKRLHLPGLALPLIACMPNAVTFSVFVISLVLVNIEVILEEKELIAKHGQDYLNYARTTPRWIFF
jgi:protein-S-isoprenylcysteine O-methyltransferase Ste14